ncbi:MAG: hypothetical protein GXX96_11325, partial [Planctomycetaceae bacterium]|nr:hypothetical protein [Planctomycetaceae bacterium]
LALPPAETQIPQHGPSFHPPGNPLTGTTTADKLVPILPAADNRKSLTAQEREEQITFGQLFGGILITLAAVSVMLGTISTAELRQTEVEISQLPTRSAEAVTGNFFFLVPAYLIRFAGGPFITASYILLVLAVGTCLNAKERRMVDFELFIQTSKALGAVLFGLILIGVLRHIALYVFSASG